MYEFTCEYCKTVKVVKYKSDIVRFCSHQCANKALNPRRKFVKVDLSYDWKEFNVGHQTRYVCRYNEHISCTDRNCAECGWNPEVAQARTKAFLKKRKAVAL